MFRYRVSAIPVCRSFASLARAGVRDDLLVIVIDYRTSAASAHSRKGGFTVAAAASRGVREKPVLGYRTPRQERETKELSNAQLVTKAGKAEEARRSRFGARSFLRYQNRFCDDPPPAPWCHLPFFFFPLGSKLKSYSVPGNPFQGGCATPFCRLNCRRALRCTLCVLRAATCDSAARGPYSMCFRG